MFLQTQIREQQNPSHGELSLRAHREQRETFQKFGRLIECEIFPIDDPMRYTYLEPYNLPGYSSN